MEKRLLFCAVLLSLFCPAAAWAKRIAPQPVKPIFLGVYQIQAAGDGSSGKIIVSRRGKHSGKPETFVIYKISYIKSLECDVQNLHITALEVCDGLLFIKTEKGGIFSCPVTGGKATAVKLPYGYEQLQTIEPVITLKIKKLGE